MQTFCNFAAGFCPKICYKITFKMGAKIINSKYLFCSISYTSKLKWLILMGYINNEV